MAGFRVRGYVVERLLGRGASSEVWRGRVATSGEPVALKRLLRTDAHQLSRAHAEAALLGVLDHPNLVRLHAVVPTPEAAVLVLDLADGGSLADLLAVRGRLAPGEVITAVAPVAAALAYVHRQGVVHGDVSAANLLFTPGGTTLLADLGVARLTGDDADAESTPVYVDPAVAAGCVPVAVSDVFMLGAVALHALTGAPLWPGDTPEQMLEAARAADVSGIPARLAAAGVPAPMAEVVVRALTVDPRHRCSAADFALDLRHSGTPVAVELSAGRRAVAPAVRLAVTEHDPPKRRVVYDPRHAARVGGPSGFAVATTRVPPAAFASGRPNRAALKVTSPDAPAATAPDATPAFGLPDQTPAFGLPDAAPAFGLPDRTPGELPPTSAVRRPRPVIPRPPQRRVDRRLAGLVGLAALAVAAVAAIVTTRAATNDPPERGRSVAATVDWAAQLRGVDRQRAAAFARRDPALLSRVYVPGRLRTADVASLRRLVPAGCRLTGLSTLFGDLRVAPGRRRAVLTARASIPASTLRCDGRPDEQVAAVAAAPVRITLVMTANGVRIADLRAD